MAEASSPGVLPAVGVRGVRHLSEITAVAEGLDHPECVTVGPDGILWAGGEAGQIYRIDPEARQWTQVGGTGGRCLGLTIDGREQLWICDVGRQALLCWDMARRAVVREIQEVEGIPLVNPNFAVFGDDGTLYVSDSGHFGQNDGFLFAVAPDGTSRVVDRRPCHFPNGLALSADGRTLYIAESTEPAVSTLQLDTFDYRWLCRLPGTVPDGLALTENGTVFVSCYRPDAIYRVDPDGTASLYATDPAGTTLAAPTNIVFAGSHRDMLYIASLGRWHIGCLSMPERGIALRYPR
ncbi:MAG: SMP-30/gluconolactonase/LRE family protein [Firmicutes bacterium]|nr:SMP-30/gluconolactonase/LRE family protein [Bacillota bacterium]